MENSTQTKRLILRSKVIQSARKFFLNNDYIEVETPVRIPVPAPEANIDAVSTSGWFLQTSPEIYMKRLLADGFQRIFQICKCFRENETGSRHLPEFTMLEWYAANQNYMDMMNQCEDLVRFVALEMGFGESLFYQGKKVGLKKPWHRITVEKAFNQYAAISVQEALIENHFDEIMVNDIEPFLGQDIPTFLYNYPAENGAFARIHSKHSSVAERFELYIRGIELCNAYSELTDQIEQEKRFELELLARKKAGKKIYAIPVKFLKALKFMPEAAGNALGIDRLVMLFLDEKCIEDVIAFGPNNI